ncbi:hypothetical protein SADUNF_Sadunf18G0002200 [Salix dunnii]|uniref:ABC1 atypical kinase-like domain-containing protein n=1 Tax=Salix dunnii TaxID=1413687 RepID=A0A835J1U6_9ROSI|nr:hypothetical protein SADUNF_Sadunf18G0002200 [Salix dunnii]
MVELEGLWVKLGQYLSSRADVLPSAFISNLKQLQNYVCHTIEKELGKSTKELFLDFDENPLATASKVVVKVQHEDIKKIILEDAKSIVDWIAWAERSITSAP